MSSFSFFEVESKSGPLSILTVCTGNICRSPLTELLLAKTLHGLPLWVHSAGTAALVDHPMTEQNCAIATGYGVAHPENHRARLLTVDMVRDADLVLALTRQHRAAIVEMLPRASRWTFTLREFARFAEVADVEDLTLPRNDLAENRLRETIDLVAQLRGSLPPLSNPADDDVVDPYRQSDDVYALSAQQIVPAVNATVGLLRRAAAGVA